MRWMAVRLRRLAICQKFYKSINPLVLIKFYFYFSYCFLLCLFQLAGYSDEIFKLCLVILNDIDSWMAFWVKWLLSGWTLHFQNGGHQQHMSDFEEDMSVL